VSRVVGNSVRVVIPDEVCTRSPPDRTGLVLMPRSPSPGSEPPSVPSRRHVAVRHSRQPGLTRHVEIVDRVAAAVDVEGLHRLEVSRRRDRARRENLRAHDAVRADWLPFVSVWFMYVFFTLTALAPRSDAQS